MLKKSALGVSLVRQREKMGFIIRDALGEEMGFSSAEVASKPDTGKSSRLSKDPPPEISSAAQSKGEMMSSGACPALTTVAMESWALPRGAAQTPKHPHLRPSKIPGGE